LLVTPIAAEKQQPALVHADLGAASSSSLSMPLH
jgi:hypothetical protein